MNIFERAARAKLRFPTPRGLVTTEQLFDMPLKAKGSGGISLDDTARTLFVGIESMGQGSFVDDNSDNPERKQAELALEIVKCVIKSKKDDMEAADKRAATIARKKVLLEALGNKQDEKIKSMTDEEIRAELAALGG